jgi:hypothetical protein
MRLLKRSLILLLTLTLATGHVRAQVVIIPEIQNSGIILKQQLWSVVINNLSGNSTKAVLSVAITDKISSQSLMQSTSNVFILNPGVKRVTYNDLAPLNYSFTSIGFSIDKQLTQPLPVGEYLVCYNLVDASKQQILATECVKVIAEPLSPPQLIQPENNSTIKDPRPVLTWTPPSPVQMFSSLSYLVIVSPLFEKQSPQEALQRNIPIMTTTSANNSLLYPPSFTNLEAGKTYVWQVAAQDAGRYGGKSEVWKFTVMPDSVAKIISMAPYVKLSQRSDEATVLHQGILKIEYFNSLADSIVNVSVYKISPGNSRGRQNFSFQMKIKAGQNLLEYDINRKIRLDETAVYEVTLVNAKKEKWQMKFNPKYYF